MNVSIPFNLKDTIGNKLKESGFEKQAEFFLRQYYARENEKINVFIRGVSPEFLTTLQDIAEELNLRGLKTQINQCVRLLCDPSSETVKSLRSFETGLANYIANNAIQGWLFQYQSEDSYLPMLVGDIAYYEARPDRKEPAYVSLDLFFNSTAVDNRFLKPKTLHFYLDGIRGKTIPDILSGQRLFKETEELILDYRKSMEDYLEFQPLFGKQFTGRGLGKKANPHDLSLTRDFVALDGAEFIRLVNDDKGFKNGTSTQNYTELKMWENYEKPAGAFEEIPFHPYICMFDLNNHKHYWILAHQLSPYQYTPEIGEKLILPEEQRDLIDILVDDMDVIKEDIVKGKSGGTTILCLGEPGVGKTLTAEVYSEIVQKPLYRVHSGQLGTDPERIEARLDEILKRSEAWGSILLLDEADVYIRERDNSIQHNSVVAAFLRKLEYFSGLLFMTTNRADDVDDAIKSRAMAIVKYEKPKAKELKLIWKALSQEFDMELSEELIDDLVKHYPEIVGRDVKEILKLAGKYNRQKNKPLDLETFRQCAIFRGVDYR